MKGQPSRHAGAVLLTLGATLLTTLAAPRVALAGSTTYELVPAKTKLVAHLLKAGIGSSLAHDHVIQAGKLEGTITLDPERPAATRIAITVHTRHLRVDRPALRKAYGMEPLDRSDMAEVRKNMRAIGQLYVAQYPTIRFVSRRVSALGKHRYRVRGTFTVRGVSRKVTLEVEARLHGERLKGSGTLKFKQSWFGYKPYSAALGAIKVRDRVTLNIYLEAVPRR